MVGDLLECLSGYRIRCANGRHEAAMMQKGCSWAAWRRARLHYCTDNEYYDLRKTNVGRPNSILVRKNRREIWTMMSKSKKLMSTSFF